jgi:hypothetical protein
MPRTFDDLPDEILQEAAYYALGPSTEAHNALLLTNKRLNIATKAVADQYANDYMNFHLPLAAMVFAPRAGQQLYRSWLPKVQRIAASIQSTINLAIDAANERYDQWLEEPEGEDELTDPEGITIQYLITFSDFGATILNMGLHILEHFRFQKSSHQTLCELRFWLSPPAGLLILRITSTILSAALHKNILEELSTSCLFNWAAPIYPVLAADASVRLRALEEFLILDGCESLLKAFPTRYDLAWESSHSNWEQLGTFARRAYDASWDFPVGPHVASRVISNNLEVTFGLQFGTNNTHSLHDYMEALVEAVEKELQVKVNEGYFNVADYEVVEEILQV